jgi:hypothetical protein
LPDDIRQQTTLFQDAGREELEPQGVMVTPRTLIARTIRLAARQRIPRRLDWPLATSNHEPVFARRRALELRLYCRSLWAAGDSSLSPIQWAIRLR